ncbi:Sec23-binding domain of Sec16-domain-containing protein [Auriculariales sp. MPI-PUGE-AT-0066]|nr:Sec23-binding domain of Sec16-domain-containing protein [Auriculariales sp. MPI-PUGE-AT-0066]
MPGSRRWRRALGYTSEATLDGARASSKLVLVRLLKVLVENDGQTSGSDTIDAAVRGALLGECAAVTAVDSMRPADAMMSAYSTAATSESFPLRGERRKAYHYALDEKMWAHALVLSSSLDKEAWKEAVQEFLRAELMAPATGASSASKGRESLRILYSLIAGQAGSSVNGLVPPKALGQPRFSDSLAATTLSPLGPTPMTANFSQPAIPTNISADILGKWQDIAATIVSNRVPGDSNGLTALGDTLTDHKWIEAAHVCYLLSANPSKTHNFSKDSDPFIFSEILEYALSLAPATPGQEPFHGFPHLQSYRLLHAWQLVEMGRDKLAQRYCDAIASTLRTINRGSPFFTLTFLEQLKELTERLVAAPQLEKTGFSLLREVAGKTTVESVSAWYGTRNTEFVVGESVDKSPLAASSTNDASKQPAGPFGAHYSSISSAARSGNSSPPLNGGSSPNGQPDLRRAGSALQLRSNTAPSIQIDRAPSAMDYLRPEVNMQRIASASARPSASPLAPNITHIVDIAVPPPHVLACAQTPHLNPSPCPCPWSPHRRRSSPRARPAPSRSRSR